VTLTSQIRWATFDCFGTLVDWRHGIATGAELVFPGQGGRVLDRYNRHELEVQRESPTMRYRGVLAESLRRACAELGLGLRADDASVLGAGIPYWPVFPEVAGALTELRESGWRLALLTNCDRDIIGETRRRLDVVIDAVVTAEDVGAYKPAHHHFNRFVESFGATRDTWVHVAQSYLHDIVPASELNIPRVWINRQAEPNDATLADAVLPDLNGLAGTVEAVHAAR
jgi:2-haloacid dehalogenase